MATVVVLEDGSPKTFVDPWVVANTGISVSREERIWKELCGKLVKRAANPRAMARINVFIVVDRQEFEEHDRPLFTLMLDCARESTWGARLFLVLTDAKPVAAFEASEYPDVRAWLDSLVTGRLTDIIQISDVDPYDGDALHSKLRNCATTAWARRKAFREFSDRRPWRCTVPAGWGSLASAIGERAIVEPDEDSRSDLLIVIGPPESSDEKESLYEAEAEVDRYLAGKAAGRRRNRVITLMHPPSLGLQRYCRSHDLGEPTAMASEFELWYFLLQLNKRVDDEEFPHPDSVHAVALAKAPNLKRSSSTAFPTVLVTTVFGPDEECQWVQAAKDLGNFLMGSPLAMEYHVELSVDPGRLKTILRRNPIVNAWVHLGHGSGSSGLWTPQHGNIGAEKWAQCFRGRELRLALFLTCDSHEIARHFAEQGTGLAVGFEGKIDSTKAQELALGILPRMLATATQGGSILDGFRLGEGWHKSDACPLDAQPRAYYPRRL
ncbi:MAG: hypothetical protein JO093_09670 [Acidobacteria bacterium]|nr:hypothetical protein [Acidobacteriota bacterium]